MSINLATAYNSGHTATLRSAKIRKRTSYVRRPLAETSYGEKGGG